MHLLYLDDSGKVHPNDPTPVAVFAGFSIPEDRWHDFVRQVSGAKAKYFPNRGKPHEWEVKSADFLTPNAWARSKNRKFCFEVADLLKRNRCFVFSISLTKAKAQDPLSEDKFVPLMLTRLIGKFYDQVFTHHTTGTVVMDWSTHQVDHEISNCVTAMTVVREMTALVGGVTYGSSASLPPLQVADLIASTMRRAEEGQPHLGELGAAFRERQYHRPEAVDNQGFPMCGIGKVF